MEPVDQELAALDEMEYLLERMLELAECSASDDCRADSRVELQKGFELLRGLLDQAAERYQRGRATE